MKKLLSVSLCLLFAASLTAQTGKIRVATVGNSITGGTNDYGYYAMMQMLRKVAPVSHEIAVVSTDAVKA